VSLIRRGDLFLTFSPARDEKANSAHPAIIVTNTRANLDSLLVVVIPITSNLERIYPFELALPNPRTGLNKNSKARINLIRHVNQSRLVRRLGLCARRIDARA
jgi:mRNA interferase MazF